MSNLFSKLASWRWFWFLWGGGLVIIATLISQGDQLVTAAVPGGMVDHQTAGTAARVDEIHQSWIDAGAMGFFKIGILLDLLFIVMYSLGGIIGGRLIYHQTGFRFLKGLAVVVIAAYCSFGIFDFVETIFQAIQVFITGGQDSMAGVAARLQRPKLMSFAIGFPVLVISLIWLWVEKRRTAAADG